MFVFLIKDMNLLHHLISKVKCVLKQVANVCYTNNDRFFSVADTSETRIYDFPVCLIQRSMVVNE